MPTVIQSWRRRVNVSRWGHAAWIEEAFVLWRSAGKIHRHAELREVEWNEIVVVIVLGFRKDFSCPRPRKRPIKAKWSPRRSMRSIWSKAPRFVWISEISARNPARVSAHAKHRHSVVDGASSPRQTPGRTRVSVMGEASGTPLDIMRG